MSFQLDAKRRITSPVKGASGELEIDGKVVRFTNLDRVLFPETGFTKRDLIDYYAAVSPVLLPHLADRPLTMRRFPEGVEEEGFWEKNCPSFRPEWVATARIASRSSSRGRVDYCLVNDLPTLVWVANLASIELHVSLAHAERRSQPDFMVFDLDPGEPAAILDCAEIALLINQTLTAQGLESHAKVSGSKGIQVYVPLNSESNYDRTGEFAHSLARAFESELPDQVVSKMRKVLRKGKVLIDWSQNSEHKTTVSVFSVRARPHPQVSTPVPWDRLSEALDRDDPGLLSFTPEWVVNHLEEAARPFEDVLDSTQRLPG